MLATYQARLAHCAGCWYWVWKEGERGGEWGGEREGGREGEGGEREGERDCGYYC